MPLIILESKRKTGFAATDDAISRIIRRQLFFVLAMSLTDSVPSDGADWLDNVCVFFGASNRPLKQCSSLFAVGDVVFFMSEC